MAEPVCTFPAATSELDRLRLREAALAEPLWLAPLWLRWERVSRQRKDLQDDTRWPAPVMPHGPSSSRQRWTNLKSGVGWVLVLVEETPTDTKAGAHAA